MRLDHHGEMVHMYSILAASSRIPASDLPLTGEVADVMSLSWKSFLPSRDDINSVKKNLIVLVSRILTTYYPNLAPLAKVVTPHITHKYSAQMALKSEVYVIDVLMKNEARSDMIDIMHTLQGYLGKSYPRDHIVASGGHQLTCERQVAAQRHMVCGNTPEERLELLEPQSEDWHCLMCFLKVE